MIILKTFSVSPFLSHKNNKTFRCKAETGHFTHTKKESLCFILELLLMVIHELNKAKFSASQQSEQMLQEYLVS